MTRVTPTNGRRRSVKPLPMPGDLSQWEADFHRESTRLELEAQALLKMAKLYRQVGGILRTKRSETIR